MEVSEGSGILCLKWGKRRTLDGQDLDTVLSASVFPWNKPGPNIQKQTASFLRYDSYKENFTISS